MKIINSKVFINGKFHEDLQVKFNQEKILEIGNNLEDDEVIDAKGNYLYAGIIDCHNHGGWRRSFSDLDNSENFEENIKFLTSKLPSHGVTTVWPTLDGPHYEINPRSVRRIRKIKNECQGAKIGKFQFEGVFMSLERYMSPDSKNPDIEYTNYLVDNDYSDIGLFHVAPNLQGSMEWIDYMVSKGVEVAVGDCNSKTEDVIEAANHGLRHADHMFNGFEPMHHRNNGTAVGVMLDDRIVCQLTCDGYHVSEAWVKLLIKIKGLKNIYGVSDQSHCSGIKEGERFFTEGKEVIAKDGFIRYLDGNIVSGNMAINETMNAAMKRLHLSREEVACLYCENVADCLKIKDRGKIEIGRTSDFVIMDDNFNVLQTIIDGQTYYKVKD